MTLFYYRFEKMRLLKIGITHGDINGIGYEVLLKVFQDPEILELFTPVVFGSAPVAAQVAEALGIEPLRFLIVENAAAAQDGHVNLVPVCKDAEPEIHFGQQTEDALQAEALSLTAALNAYRDHSVDALVTLPGHLDNDDAAHALSDFIRRAFDVQEDTFDWAITGPVRLLKLQQIDVSTELGAGLASERFQAQIKAVSEGLRSDCGLIRPRLAVVSTQSKLRYDIEELREAGVMVFGPFDAQTFVEGAWQQHYDACIFLGADDAYKQILAAEDSDLQVGYVSGLPLVLTYPMQDIAYDQAGKGETSEVPLRESLYAAIDIVRHRIAYHHATYRPLEKQWVPRGRDDFKLDLTKEE